MNLIIKYLTLIKAKLNIIPYTHCLIYKTILSLKSLLSKGFLRIILYLHLIGFLFLKKTC